ncbi:MAG: hypothetical protein KAS62_01000, partial [Candidatus Delongbacteria bacterium]|nr:hypothetical protein [Candidatus Delongbacteria bacterium]
SVPIVYLYDTSDIISNSEFKVQWYGNSNDSTNLNYFYCVTTDTTLSNTSATTILSQPLWYNTLNNFADISFPMTKFNSDILFIDSTTYIDTVEAIEVTRKVVFSKFFIYGMDEYGAVSEVSSKVFGRINQKPKYPMVTSNKFDINGYNEYWFTIGPDSAEIVLPNETSFWKPIDFRWMSEDPDGHDVKLEFKWELWALDGTGADIEIVDQSSSWSIDNLSVEFSSVLYHYNSEGKYSFRVWVRDDALEQAENHATVNFSVYAPQFDRGVLYLDDTDDSKFNSANYLEYTGNPDGAEVNAMYEQFLVDAGYTLNNADPLLDYDVIEFIEPLPGELYQPSLKILSNYRMVVIASEDRTRSTGINYAYYKEQLSDYMDIGGKVMIIGHSAILLNDLYVNSYEEPVRDVFDNPTYLNTDMCSFFYDYFGIYSYSTGESKTHFVSDMYAIGHPLNPSDFYLTENYDFVGVTKYDHITDVGIGALKVDSVQVNKFWKNYVTNLGPFTDVVFELTLKENGTVLTGVPTFEAFKGEIVLEYESIYDLPFEAGSDSTTVDPGGVIHALDWYNPAADATDNLKGPVLRKTGAVATRYISNGDIYRSAYIGFPLVFMDNTEGKVSDLFTAMIDWFDLEIDPADNWK